ncbi:MAG: SPOR domain-containing protein [Erythrobacter sp.]
MSGSHDDTAAGDGVQHDELDLAADDSLPWLESDEQDVNGGGVDTTQIVGFILGLAAILVVVVGAVWYISNAGSGSGPEPDGSTIAAPEGPIKERPDDPGGKEFAGTGNVAPVVGEGGTREGRLATSDEASGEDDGTPSADTASTDEAAAENEPEPALSGVGVQLAAYRSRERAQQGWRDLRARTEVLNGVDYRITRGVVDIGTVYRLQAIASNRAAGIALCERLKADGLDCQVKS